MAKSNVLPDVPSPQRDFKQREQQNSKTAIGLDGKTTTLHVHHAFLYISLPSLPNFTYYGGREPKTTTLLFSFS